MTEKAIAPSLYSLGSELNQTLTEIADSGGEITIAQEEALAKVQTLLTEKADGCVEWVQSQEDLIALADQKIADLKAFKDRINGRLTKFDSYVNDCMKLMGTQKIDGKLCSISKRKPSKVVVIKDEKKLPVDFIRIPEPTPEPMKKEIGEALKAGKEVPGASLEDSTKITIQYKLK